jgi:D-alanyl-D-alanine carboxypeptidase (penicillin-binding protein 5/6)
MTALLAIEAINSGRIGLDDMVTASYTSPDGLSLDGSTQNIVPGETMSLRNLLYCNLVASANESCNIIGEYVAGGNIKDFLALMNQRAKELGCTNTHFSNTHGLHDVNHYTTALDLYKIVKEAEKHPLFVDITNTITIDIPATNKSPLRHLVTTNYLISPYRTTYYYQYAKGIKTGTTDEAGYCLISSASKNGVNLVAVIMGAGEKTLEDGTHINTAFTESKRLYEWAFSNYKKRDLAVTSDLIKEIPIKLGKGVNSIIVKPQTGISALLPSDSQESDFSRNIVIYSERDKTPLTAPISAGQVVGEISVSYKGTVAGTAKLISSTSVEQSNFQYIIHQIVTNPLLLILSIIFILALIIFLLFIITNRKRLRNRSRYNNRGYSGKGRRRR